MPASPDAPNFARHPALLDRTRSVLVIVDVQEKLLPVVLEPALIQANIVRLIQAATLWKIPIIISEQYPRGLGLTVEAIRTAATASSICEKLDFSCCGSTEFRETLLATARDQIVVVGIETHVCVLQTVLDLLMLELQPYVVADAVSARGRSDHDISLLRMHDAGAISTTTESVLFEWCERAGTPEFKQISALVKATR